MKWVHREIANSDTYQRSWQTNETNAADERNFSRAVPRRLPAEVAYDAVQMATASDAKAAELHTRPRRPRHRDGFAAAQRQQQRHATPDGLRPLDPRKQLRLRPLEEPSLLQTVSCRTTTTCCR